MKVPEAGPSFSAAQGAANVAGALEKQREEGEEGRASSDEGKEGGAWVSGIYFTRLLHQLTP